MFLNIKKFSVISLFFISASVMASTTVLFNSATGSQQQLSSSGVTVTAWSDTKYVRGDGPGDGTIEQAKEMYRWGNGWGIINQDENWSDNPGHSADNIGSEEKYRDYDFFLFSFTDAVNISQATYSWRNGRTGRNQVSVAAMTSSASAPAVNGSNWSTLAGQATSDWSQMRNGSGNYYTNFGAAGAGNAGNVSDVYSKYWLIGALNSTFGGSSNLEGNDGFKLAGITYSTKPGGGGDGQPIPEPSSLAILGLALFGMFGASRRKNK